MHLGKNITYECLLNDPVFCQVLNTINDDVLEENV